MESQPSKQERLLQQLSLDLNQINLSNQIYDKWSCLVDLKKIAVSL